MKYGCIECIGKAVFKQPGQFGLFYVCLKFFDGILYCRAGEVPLIGGGTNYRVLKGLYLIHI
jgi:hypothetical protein